MTTERGSNIRIVCLTSFLSGVHAYMTRAIIQPFALAIVNSMTFVGLVDGLMFSLGPSLIQLPSGWFSDRVGRRLPLMIGSVMIVLASVMFLVVSVTANPVYLLIGAALFGFGTFGAPAKDSLVAESVDRTRRVMTYNLVAFAAASPGIFASVVGGTLAEAWGFATVFLIAIGLEAITLGIFYIFVHESLDADAQEVLRVDHVAAFLRNVFKVPRKVSVFLLIIAIDGFIWGLGYKILYGMLRKGNTGFTMTQIGILGSAGVVSWTLFQIPIGRIMRQYGCRLCLILSEISGGLGLLGVLLLWGRGYLYLIPCLMLVGLIPAFWIPAVRLLMANSVPDRQRAETLGKLALFTGAAGFAGAVVGGLLYELRGPWLPITLNIIGAAAMAVTIRLAIHETPDHELADRRAPSPPQIG